MTQPYVVQGQAGTGSVAVEAALTLIGEPYLVEEMRFRTGPGAAPMDGANPMRQVPALRLPSGELMTESAAILIWLAESHPAARLAPAPAPASPLRPAFLRWMSFVSAAIYSLYWVRDEPSRLAADPAHEAVIKDRTRERIAHCWEIMERQTSPGRYILGEELSVLDLYVTVISRWTPRRRRFYELAPRLGAVVRLVDADPRLARLWAERFPFTEGWEG